MRIVSAPLFGFVLFSTLLTISAAESQDRCGRSPWIERIYQREVALFEKCGASAACLEQRSRHIQAALAEAPNDLSLHRIYQFIAKSGGAEAERELIEHYRARAEQRRTAGNLFLYARILEDPSRKEALLEEAVALDAGLPGPHEILAGLYVRRGDLDASREALDRFLRLCPTSFRTYRNLTRAYPASFPGADFWRPHLEAAGRYLRALPLEHHFHRLPDLWSAELELMPLGYRATHRQIRSDLEAIMALDPGDEPGKEATWWRVIHVGFSHLGDEAGKKRSLEHRVELEPCQADVVDAVIAAWKDSRALSPPSAVEQRDEWFAAADAASRAWLETCPTSWRYWATRVSALAPDQRLSDDEVLGHVEEARRRAEVPEYRRSVLATSLARVLYDRSLKAKRGEDWLGKELEHLGALSSDSGLDLSPVFDGYAPKAGQGEPPSAVGRHLAPFELTDLDGKRWTSEALKGKIVYLDIWTSGCLPCRKAMPEIERLHELTSKVGGLQVLTLSADDVRSHAIALSRGGDYSFPVLVDPAYARELGVEAYPTQWLVGGDSKIVRDLTFEQIPYDGAWVGSVFALMQEEARRISSGPVG